MRRSRWTRWVGRIGWSAVTALALTVAAAVAGLPVYVFPPQAPPGRADVVFVIGPPDRWRIQLAEELIAERRATTLMISVPSPDYVPECTEALPFRVLCSRPDPFTTQGEARWLKAEMTEHGWTSATVITTTPHVVRTRVRMDRCVPHGVQVIGRPTGLTFEKWAWHYLYQTAGFVKVVLQPTC